MRPADTGRGSLSGQKLKFVGTWYSLSSAFRFSHPLAICFVRWEPGRTGWWWTWIARWCLRNIRGQSYIGVHRFHADGENDRSHSIGIRWEYGSTRSRNPPRRTKTTRFHTVDGVSCAGIWRYPSTRLHGDIEEYSSDGIFTRTDPTTVTPPYCTVVIRMAECKGIILSEDHWKNRLITFKHSFIIFYDHFEAIT